MASHSTISFSTLITLPASLVWIELAATHTDAFDNREHLTRITAIDARRPGRIRFNHCPAALTNLADINHDGRRDLHIRVDARSHTP
jgi:hypothetical protein